MKITHLASACNIIQHGNIKILSDPWLFMGLGRITLL